MKSFIKNHNGFAADLHKFTNPSKSPLAKNISKFIANSISFSFRSAGVNFKFSEKYRKNRSFKFLNLMLCLKQDQPLKKSHRCFALVRYTPFDTK